MQTNFPEIGLELFLLFAMAPLSEGCPMSFGLASFVRGVEWTQPLNIPYLNPKISPWEIPPCKECELLGSFNCPTGCEPWVPVFTSHPERRARYPVRRLQTRCRG